MKSNSPPTPSLTQSRPSTDQQLSYTFHRHGTAIRSLTERFALVFVEGPPGSGKSTLAQTLAADGALVQSFNRPGDRRRLQTGASAIVPKHRKGTARNILVIDNADPVRVLSQIIELRTWIVAGWRLVCMASQRSDQVRRAIRDHLPSPDHRTAGADFGVYALPGIPAPDRIALDPDSWPYSWLHGDLIDALSAEDDQASDQRRLDTVESICFAFNPPIKPAYRTRTFEDRMARMKRNLADNQIDEQALDAIARTPELEPYYQPRHSRPDALMRFARLVAHAIVQPLNFSALARTYGVAPHTAEAHFAALERHLLTWRQPPFVALLPSRPQSRLVRRPRAFFTDTGLLHALLEVTTLDELLAHSLAAQSWTNFVVNALRHHFGLSPAELPFWANHTGLQVDALWRSRTPAPVQGTRATPATHGGALCAAIATLEPRPRLNRVLRTTCERLQLDTLWLITPGNRSYPLSEQVHVLAIRDFAQLRAPAAPACG
ncbi:MAG: DUF4143 domain-containing protein [Spirochaetaceae bacterium]|nr:MAG: DUF4143 domain-containing protein [Spirochaetaceae bacterium]